MWHCCKLVFSISFVVEQDGVEVGLHEQLAGGKKECDREEVHRKSAVEERRGDGSRVVQRGKELVGGVVLIGIVDEPTKTTPANLGHDD